MFTLLMSCFVLAILVLIVMDTLAHHFSTSRFQKLNPKRWNAQISWMTPNDVDDVYGRGITKKFLGVPLDAWHILKYIFLGLIFIPFTVLFTCAYQFVESVTWNLLVWYAICWVIHTIAVWLVYGKILRRPNTGGGNY